MKQVVYLETDRLFLRTLKKSDVTENYIRGLNDPDIRRYLFDARFIRHTRQSVEGFVDSHWTSADQILFGLFLKDRGEFIGTIRVGNISKIHFSASLGICIFSKSCWGKGFGTEAVEGVVRYLFQELGLHYVEAGAYVENKASIRLFQKAGFGIQAEFQNKYRFETDFMPVVILGRVNPEFNYRKLK